MSNIRQNTNIEKITLISNMSKIYAPMSISYCELEKELEAQKERMRDLEQRVERAKRALDTFDYTPPVPVVKSSGWWERLRLKLA